MSELFAEFLEYAPDTGRFTWKKRASSKADVGTRAGRIQSLGYRQIKLKGRAVYAHRLAWFFVYGAWPEEEIDHINRNRDDNRIENLRACSRSQNLQNKGGVVGCYFDGRRGRWVAEICGEKGKIYLGSFSSKDSASLAYRDAKLVHHDFQAAYP